MKFAEIDVFGIYIAPIAAIMLAAWIITVLLRRLADRFGMLSYVWHPPFFLASVYMIVISSIVLIIAR